MPSSAVTQPRPWPLSQGGSRSSSVAVTRTWVSPNFTKHEPSAYFTTPRSSHTARSASGCRRLGRMAFSHSAPGGAEHAFRAWSRKSQPRPVAVSLGLSTRVLDHLAPLAELSISEILELLGRA